MVTRIGVVATSSQIPQIELQLGVQHLRGLGFQVDVHPATKKADLFFAGSDEVRAAAFLDYAMSPDHSVIWCARGGHGAIRLLPLLERLSKGKTIPTPKLLVGFSDVTALTEFVRTRWGWSTLHAPVLAMRKISVIPRKDWAAMVGWVSQRPVVAPWDGKKLKFWTAPPASTIEGELVGGNLTVWNALLGTPYQMSGEGKILFFEDVDESLYRIDRMLTQLSMTSSVRGVKAVVLGNFLNCRDHCPSVLKNPPSPRVFKDPAKLKTFLTATAAVDLKPLRKVHSTPVALKRIFREFAARIGDVPVAFGLPVGHGPEVSPLPLGGQYRLDPDGRFRLLGWDWLG